MLANNILILEY